MSFLFGVIAWFVVDLVLEVIGEGFLELTRVLNEEEAARPVAIAWFVAIGLALGAGSTLVAAGRVIQRGPFLGVSLLVVPAALGVFMEAWGRLRSSREHRISHLATWYGGASMGFGLAAGRLGAMLLLIETPTVAMGSGPPNNRDAADEPRPEWRLAADLRAMRTLREDRSVPRDSASARSSHRSRVADHGRR